MISFSQVMVKDKNKNIVILKIISYFVIFPKTQLRFLQEIKSKYTAILKSISHCMLSEQVYHNPSSQRSIIHEFAVILLKENKKCLIMEFDQLESIAHRGYYLICEKIYQLSTLTAMYYVNNYSFDKDLEKLGWDVIDFDSCELLSDDIKNYLIFGTDEDSDIKYGKCVSYISQTNPKKEKYVFLCPNEETRKLEHNTIEITSWNVIPIVNGADYRMIAQEHDIELIDSTFIEYKQSKPSTAQLAKATSNYNRELKTKNKK